MDTNNIIIAVVAIVVLILIIKFAKSVIKFVLVILLVVGLGIYAFLFLNGIDSIDDLHNKYCENLSERNDSLKCVCIVQPIEEDLRFRYTDNQLDSMSSATFKTQLMFSLGKKSIKIKKKLQENNALNLLDEFKQDFLKK